MSLVQATIELPGQLDSVSLLDAWLRDQTTRAGTNAAVVGDMRLCLAEVATNIVSYGSAAPESLRVTVRLTADASHIAAEIEDNSFRFNPLARPAAEKITSLADSHIGGFGIELVRSTASLVRYDHLDGHNRLTIRCGGEERVDDAR